MAKKTAIKHKKVAGATSTGKVIVNKKTMPKLPKKPAKLKIKPLKALPGVKSVKMGKIKSVKIAAIGKAHGLKGKPKSAAHKAAISAALKASHARRKKGHGKVAKTSKKVATKATKSHIRGPKPTTKAGRAKRGSKVHMDKMRKNLTKHSKMWLTDTKARKRTFHSTTGKPLGRKPKKKA